MWTWTCQRTFWSILEKSTEIGPICRGDGYVQKTHDKQSMCKVDVPIDVSHAFLPQTNDKVL